MGGGIFIEMGRSKLGRKIRVMLKIYAKYDMSVYYISKEMINSWIPESGGCDGSFSLSTYLC